MYKLLLSWHHPHPYPHPYPHPLPVHLYYVLYFNLYDTIMTMTMKMTMKISLFDINHLNTMIRENKAEKIMWLMNRRPYKTI